MARPALRIINRYSDLLTLAATKPPGEQKQFSSADVDTLQQLHAEGLLQFHQEAQEISRLRITPKGALALIQWNELLAKHSPFLQFLNTVERMSWLVTGAALAALFDLLK